MWRSPASEISGIWKSPCPLERPFSLVVNFHFCSDIASPGGCGGAVSGQAAAGRNRIEFLGSLPEPTTAPAQQGDVIASLACI